MAEPLHAAVDEVEEPDISHLVVEDNTPVDTILSERQMRLLVDSLYSSWEGRRFVALANVGLFSSANETAVVPDVLVSLDVEPPANFSNRLKKHKSYFVWVYGKPPDVVIEVVSNRDGGEEEKLKRYARMGVAYAVIYDPEGYLGPRPLKVFERQGVAFSEMVGRPWLTGVGLGLALVPGAYEGYQTTWLRWCDADGNVLATGSERAEAEKQRAEAEKQRAEAEKQRAEAEKQRADRLAARLRDLGF
jgi:Uma2 family endonuclease